MVEISRLHGWLMLQVSWLVDVTYLSVGGFQRLSAVGRIERPVACLMLTVSWPVDATGFWIDARRLFGFDDETGFLVG